MTSRRGAVIAGALAGLGGIAAAQFGTTALYVVVMVLVATVVLVAIGDQVRPALTDAVARIDPHHHPRRRRPGPAARSLAATAAVIGTAGLAWVVAQQGAKAMLAVGALVVAGVATWLLFPLVRDLVVTPPTDVEPRPRPDRPAPRTGHGRVTRAIGSAMTVGAAAVLAWTAAQLGLKGVLVLIGGLGLAALLLVVRDRSVFFTFAAVCSLTFVLHKSFGPQDLELSGGAISVYITTFDAVLLLLYGIWIREGTFRRDVQTAWREQPVLRLPLWGAMLLLPSVLAAVSPVHVAAELTRMGWMYLLFLYVAVRVRTRRHVWAVLGGLGVFAAIELVVVVLQWRTGGVLGLSFLGVPTQLGERVTDSSVIGRPFGTIIHPVFMGAVMGSLALVALGLGLTLRRSLTKTVALAGVGVGLLPLYLAHTRASLAAFVIVAVGVVVVALRRRDLQWSTVGRASLVGLGALVVLWGPITDKIAENVGTGHFFEEIDSRQELNVLAVQIWADHPLVGVGLNNFEQVMGPYERYGIIFFDNPVHNLYLLVLSETGVVGLVGLLLVGGGMLLVAVRLSRARDRLYRGIGLGIAGVMVFLAVEELLGFSLRQDIPLAIYWLLAGLAVSCTQLARPTADPEQLDDLTDAVRELRAAQHRQAAERDHNARAAAVAHLDALERRVHELVAQRRAVIDELLWFDELAAMTDEPIDDEPIDRDDLEAELAWLDEVAAMGPGLAVPPGRPAARRRFGMRAAAAVALSLLALAALLPSFATPSQASSTNGLRITFSATERATGIGGIYVANGDGTGVTRITPPDGRVYSWPQFALGGTRIVYTVRTGPEGNPEDLRIMDADGSDDQLIRHFDYRIGQPKIDDAGRSLVLTAQAPWFPVVALYQLDLTTLEATNLSAVTQPNGAIDADPMFTPDGRRLVFAQSDLEHTQVALMGIDGTDRRLVTSDSFFNTDPDMAPDGSEVAIASYRGEGNPGVPGRVSLVGVKPQDWHLVTRDLRTGHERVLTEGQRCIERTPADPCSPDETSAFKPRYTPDGAEIGFNGSLDATRTCLCVIGRDGSNPRVLLAPPELALDWFDWIVPTAAPPTAAAIGSAQRSSQLLVTRAEAGQPAQLVAMSPDLMQRRVLALPAGLVPTSARWTPDHGRVVFTARVPVDPTAARPHPAPPPGERRREHVTLENLDPVALTMAAERVDPSTAEEQVFLREADGSVRQLTDPWIEDWRDGVPAGDARANTDPVISADGSTVLVTNTSTTTGESFLLRIDVRTGDVVNLTNGTSGILPVQDASAALSPDGRTAAFIWADTGAVDVATMRATDGLDVRRVTTDDAIDAAPTFTPDGQALVYASHRGGGDPTGLDGWVLVRLDLAAGTTTQLTALDASPTWHPVVAPEGDRVLYVGTTGRSLDVFTVPAAPGTGSPTVRQPDPHADELFVDWR